MKKIAFLLVLSVFITAGCDNDPPKHRQVAVIFTAKSLTNSSSNPTGTGVEDEIQKILLFGVDDQDKVEKFSVIYNPSSNGVTLTISSNIKSLYAIANPSPDLEYANPANALAIIDIINDFSNVPGLPLLMSGMANIYNETVHIELVRAVAKIKIIGENGFQISSVTVMNTSSKGYVFPKTPFSVPEGKTDYPAIDASDPTFYLAENTTVSPTKFVVSGQFDGEQTTYIIEQLITNGGATPVNIVRNNCYEVSITPNTDYDCSITVTILDWVDVPVDGHTISDENFE